MADTLSFDWDQANITHIALHSLTPAEIETVFGNNPIDIDYDVIGGEERWTVIGHANSRVVIVVFTVRGEAIRPVTAYDATKRMREEYLKDSNYANESRTN